MGRSILLLHGALGSKQQLRSLADQLEDIYDVHSFNFIGHGGNEIPNRLNMDILCEQLHQYIEQNIPADHELIIFGYSMGGYAALLLATKNVCKIDRIITLGTKLDWNETQVESEIKMLNPTVIGEKIPAFALELKERHQPADWKLLLEKTAEMMRDLGKNKYLNTETFNSIQCPCKLMVGDKDKMVSLEETRNAFQQINNASLSVLPSTSHPIEKVDLKRLTFELTHI